MDPAPILLAVTILILALAWAWIIWLVLQSQPTAPPRQTCTQGQCATNLYNGEKRCPDPGQTIDALVGTEVCNSAYLCENPATPYALQGDGSTNADGLCPEGVVCRCLRRPQCPEYITATFSTSGGTPYAPLPGQRLTFPQTVTSPGTPTAYDNPLVTYCAIPPAWINRAVPGCGFAQTVDAESITTCMGLISGCTTSGSVALSSPCLEGSLAFVPSSADSFTLADLQSTPLACVRGLPCPCGKVAVWDNQLGGTVCYPR